MFYNMMIHKDSHLSRRAAFTLETVLHKSTTLLGLSSVNTSNL